MYPLKQRVITWVAGLLQTYPRFLSIHDTESRVSLSRQAASSCPYNIRGESGDQVPAEALRQLTKWTTSLSLTDKSFSPGLEPLNITIYLIRSVSTCYWEGTVLSILCVVANQSLPKRQTLLLHLLLQQTHTTEKPKPVFKPRPSGSTVFGLNQHPTQPFQHRACSGSHLLPTSLWAWMCVALRPAHSCTESEVHARPWGWIPVAQGMGAKQGPGWEAVEGGTCPPPSCTQTPLTHLTQRTGRDLGVEGI